MSFHFEFDEQAMLREVERQAQPAMDRMADPHANGSASATVYLGPPMSAVAV